MGIRERIFRSINASTILEAFEPEIILKVGGLHRDRPKADILSK